jgi:glycosyltransferase involved in cell wall biosynthesis
VEKKKIAVFAEKLYGGGVEKILQIVCRNFDYSRYDLTLYASRKEEMPLGTYPEHLKIQYIFDDGNGLLTKMKNKLKLFVYYHFPPSFYYKLLIRKRYDVGIAFIEGYATRFLSGAPTSMKKIGWVHIELNTFHWTDVAFRSRQEEVKCYHDLDKIVCVSQTVKNQVDQLFGCPDSTIVLYNPIEKEKILAQSEENLPEEYKNRKHQIRMVSLGTLNKRKSYDRLLVAVNRLIKNGCDVELMILGSGEEQDSLKSYIAENGLEDSVYMVGFVHNPYPFVKSADIYVCSSFAEGYNTAVTEALILGKAVVSTEVSGIREQLGDSEYGIVTENSIDGLYTGLEKMCHDGTFLKYQKKAQEVSERYNLQNQMNQIYDVIES